MHGFGFLASWLLLTGGALAAEDATSPVREMKQVEAASNNSLLWGPYRPNLYFGVRPRIPQSLMTALVWAKVEDYQGPQNDFRFTCEQNEGMQGYGWDEYDIREGGRQVIHDTGNSLDLTIDFVKVPGGDKGGSWGARIKGQPQADADPEQLSTVIFVATMEGDGKMRLETPVQPEGYEGDVNFAGATPELGDFKLDVTRGPESNEHPVHDHPSYQDKPLNKSFVSSMLTPVDVLWQSRKIVFLQIRETVKRYLEAFGQDNIPPPAQLFTIPNQSGEEGNSFYVQKVFKGTFEFDILFSSGAAEKPLTSKSLTQRIKDVKKSFSARFHKAYAPVAPFNTPKYEDFSKAMLSNLVGGIGYFFGDSIVDRSYAPEYEEENEGFWEETQAARARANPMPDGAAELFTAVPSRPFFPRGFLWDEGFHLIPIMDWDLDLTLQITKSWFSLMDDDGWIAREQILGPEARSKVPPEFQVQYPHYANPPTLFLVIESLAEKALKSKQSGAKSTDGKDVLSGDLRNAPLEHPDILISYLRSIYPLLKRQYFWFRKTQKGDLKSYDRDAFSMAEAYRWRGRSVQHILTSGLDDYPRPQPPHPGELHVDLISWVGMMTSSLKNIADVLGDEDDVAEFAGYEKAILRNIDDLHWNEKEQMYCDATIDEYEEHSLVCHKGYISLFPFMTGLLDANSPRLGAILDLIGDREELWSDFGIRSLSKNDEFYGTDENYWRGPIWININYMILKNLLDVAQTEGPHQQKALKLYTDLRKNLVDNVFKEWKKTGFAWEQYNPEDGHGQRTQHFTGWTSLVVKMMVMPDLSTAKETYRDEL